MPRTRALVLLSLLCTSLFVSRSSARAATPVEGGEVAVKMKHGETQVSVAGLARTRIAAEHVGGPRKPQATLVMARLRARATHHGAGLVNIEFDAMAPTSPLLDLYSEVDLGSPISVRLGLFKVPLSREMFLPITSHPIFERSWINQHLGVRRRAGASLAGKATFGDLEAHLQTSVFNATMNLNQMLNDGLLWVSALDLRSARLHTDLHIAFMEHLLEPAQRLDPVTMTSLYPRDHQLDLALYHERGPLRVLVEGLLALDQRDAHEPTPTHGLHALLAYEFRGRPMQEGGHGLEPALSLDYLGREGGERLRVTGNLNWLIAARGLQASVAYAFEPDLGAGQPLRHLGLMQLQGSF